MQIVAKKIHECTLLQLAIQDIKDLIKENDFRHSDYVYPMRNFT